MRWHHLAGTALLLPMAVVGCATTSDETLNYVATTNRTVQRLEQNLTPAVQNLNETATDLKARLETTEQQTAALTTNVETLQYQLQSVQDQLNTLQERMYGASGRSTGKSAVPSAPGGPVVTPGEIAPAGPGEAVTEVPSAPGGMGAPPSAPSALDQVAMGPATAPAEPPPTAGEIPLDSLSLQPAQGAGEAPAGGGIAAPTVDMYEQAKERYKAQDYNQALKLFNAYLEQNPTGDKAARAEFWKGETLLKMKNNRDAIELFEKVRRDNPTNSIVPYAMYRQAEAHLQQGEKDEAMNLLRELVRDWPGTEPAQTARREMEKRGLQ
jgi:tol-pal system protein YbgF